MSEADRIQTIARQMAYDLDEFNGDGTGLQKLSFSLKARLALLEQAGADTAWVEDLRTFRNEIEAVNAFFIESRRRQLNDDEQRKLRTVLEELREALVEY
jgi:hypothetical protein